MVSLARLPEQLCPLCTRFSFNGIVCGLCQQSMPPFQRLFASYRYVPPLRQLLHACKHQRRLYLIDTLINLMLRHPPLWLKQHCFDAVLAMPLSRQRLFGRGFNQSALLAGAVARWLQRPLLPVSAVERVHRPAQSTLGKLQRKRNIRGAFRIRHNVQGLNLLLIDDVVTTGATVAELARMLEQAGAGAVFVWVLSRPE